MFVLASAAGLTIVGLGALLKAGLAEEAPLSQRAAAGGLIVWGTFVLAFGTLAFAAEAVSLVVDPLGTLAGYGVGWLIEHCQPLQDALDWIAGDPPRLRPTPKPGTASPPASAR